MMIPTVPFKECYFLEDALRFRKELKLPLVYVGGVVSRANVETVLDSGFEFVQMGRALVTQPDFVNRMRENDGDMACSSGCEHRNYLHRAYVHHRHEVPQARARPAGETAEGDGADKVMRQKAGLGPPPAERG